jgi:hypothetical protein
LNRFNVVVGIILVVVGVYACMLERLPIVVRLNGGVHPGIHIQKSAYIRKVSSANVVNSGDTTPLEVEIFRKC